MMQFDEYADDYETALERGIGVSGEEASYFARGRIACLARRLCELGVKAGSILDFGCGTGSAVPWLKEFLSPRSIIGVDRSPRSIEVARQTHGAPGVEFLVLGDYQPYGSIDVAFSNGVFHHIAPPDRAEALAWVRRALRSGGIFAFWENNPWNPGTRYVMRRIPFDRDATPVSASEGHRLLTAAGFEIERTEFLFIFPHALRMLRWLEGPLCRLPLGAQYGILCRSP